MTEKIDGTNAQIYISTHQGPGYDSFDNRWLKENRIAVVDSYDIFAGSRTRLITPGNNTDNFGFAAWVRDNASELVKLGPGRHYGEWYGQGIQRGYGLSEKRFALFNVGRWEASTKPACCEVVPVLYRGEFDGFMGHQWDVMDHLKQYGSKAVPGFMDPEGIVVFHEHARVAFKKTFDDNHKGQE